GLTPRHLLSRLLLGTDGYSLRGGRDESWLDRGVDWLGYARKPRTRRRHYRPHCWCRHDCNRCDRDHPDDVRKRRLAGPSCLPPFANGVLNVRQFRATAYNQVAEALSDRPLSFTGLPVHLVVRYVGQQVMGVSIDVV